MSVCDQCGYTADRLTLTEYGDLCDRCAYRQEERSGHGYGLSAGTFGFLSETE